MHGKRICVICVICGWSVLHNPGRKRVELRNVHLPARFVMHMPVTPDEFRAALSRFPSGVTVVTSRVASGEQYGITVSAFCSVSLRPPLILVSIEKGVASHSALHESDAFVVNILGKDQDFISQHFALPSPVEFEDVKTRPGIDGVPVLKDALVALECRLRHAYEGGDHTIFVGEVEHATIRDGEPLVYFHGNYRDLLAS